MDPITQSTPICRQGVCHLDLSKQAVGKIVISMERDGTLHLNGNMMEIPERAKQWSGIPNEVYNRVSNITGKGGFKHGDIDIPPGATRIGGAAAYSDGKGALYVTDFSGDFGKITRPALLKCLEGELSSDKLYTSPDIEDHGMFVADKGRRLLEDLKLTHLF